MGASRRAGEGAGGEPAAGRTGGGDTVRRARALWTTGAALMRHAYRIIHERRRHPGTNLQLKGRRALSKRDLNPQAP
eukprot:4746148-Prymnesium_polylepis.1